MTIPVKTRRFADDLEAACHTCAEPGPTTPVHAHDFVEIGLIDKGWAWHHLGEDQASRILAGDVFIIDRYQPHYYSDTHGLEVSYLLLGPATFNRSLADFRHTALPSTSPAAPPVAERVIPFAPCFHPLAGMGEEVRSIFSRIQRELLRRDWGYRLLVEALLVELFVAINRLTRAAGRPALPSRTGRSGGERIDAVVALMEQHYAEGLRLSDLARCACLQPQYLCRLFRRRTGMSTVEYLTHVRIRRACDLLAHTEDPVTEICFRTGFRDLSHFTRTFRKITGTNPRDYRKKSR